MSVNPSSGTDAATAPLHVLVVDDNAASAQTMGWMVEVLGHRVTVAHSGAEAMEKAAHLKPDAILLDIGLPDMDGYAVCHGLRNVPELKDTVLIAQTGWGDAAHRQQARDAGFHHYLVKPIKLDDLGAVLAGTV